MSSLHIWFSKLKWSLDVLLRFYERHAFICALHKVSNIPFMPFLAFLLRSFTHFVFFSKETKLLFDELNFCLQRLYSIPFHVDMPFNDSILEEITTAEASCPLYCFSRSSFPSLHRNPNLEVFLSLQEAGALYQLCLQSAWMRMRIRNDFQVYKKREHCANCACNRTGSSSSSCGGAVSTPGDHQD